ncbi:hypothetical protein [Geobacter pickeringii]|uniref:Uncharacterized protein n=1 Tax=Geobacter pickeringii TaxID=345632 RepID=A0A0B5BC05_9BACT|nr:hypothetical protein [Geobacter pickeringii]AJE02085.1 hypothetical protein GPICK_00660 [Geobacter pickeringii]
MTRSKTKPTVAKPLFDPATAIRFAEGGAEGRPVAASDEATLVLRLDAEVFARLTIEAARKEKSVEHLVERLIAKYLAKR